MFGRHKRQGKESGVTIRNQFASVALDTSLFELGNGFMPTSEFFKDPYVLGAFITYANLFRAFVFKGGRWSTVKSGEFILAALEGFQGTPQVVDPKEVTSRLADLQGDSDFTLGAKHAELSFGALFDLLKQSDNDPIVLQAREIAQDFDGMSAVLGQPTGDPDEGFKIAIHHLTLKEQLENRFPDSMA